jgi:hypothetical protein
MSGQLRQGERAKHARDGGSPDAQGDACDRPLFIVGAERSGSTLLRLMLDHHPSIAVPFEFDFAIECIPGDHAWPELADYHAWLATDRIFGSSGLRIDPTLPYDALVRDFLRQKHAASGKPIIGATLHRRFDQAPRLWPGARYVHLLRDGRDVARSTIQMGWAGNVWTAIERWIEAEGWWERLRAQLPAEHWVEVRFGELIRDPRGALAPVCALVGVPLHGAMLDYHLDTTYDQLDPRLVEQWRHKLSPLAIRLIELRAGALLAERGYEASGLAPLPSAVGRLDPLFRLHSRLACARDYLSELLARRLALRRRHRGILQRINQRRALQMR